ncbi:hypothetical protein ACH61_00697 [Rathayibacter tanaceti]|uniref:Uncharacterized protein n=1 Tax=Rathayibacter tanaceti TaxID=1671680 RepID=A0A162G036_9MICO|nr:hypothetical protein ACH61_00697 [Rathayibacter tanaceti]
MNELASVGSYQPYMKVVPASCGYAAVAWLISLSTSPTFATASSSRPSAAPSSFAESCHVVPQGRPG